METFRLAGWRDEAKKVVGSGMDKAYVGPSLFISWWGPFWEKKRLLSHKLVAVDSLSCQSERELMKSIIPEKNQSTIFDKLIQAAVDDFISEGEVITINCHQKCWSLGIKIMSTTICCNLRYKLVGSFPDRAVWVRALAGDIGHWARHFLLKVPLSTQVYKLVPTI